MKIVQEQLREPSEEVFEVKSKLKESMVDRQLMENFVKEMKEQLDKYDKTFSNAKKMLKISLVLQNIRKRNLWLYSERKKLKGKVKEL